MNRVSVFVRRQRIKKLDKWTMRAIIAECFFLAIFPSVAAAAVLIGIIAWFLRLQIDTKFKLRSLPFDVPAGLFVFISAISVFTSSARSFELIYHYFAFVGIYSLTYILIGQNIRTRAQVRSVILTLAASALIVVLCGYFQYIFGIDTADMKWVDPEKFPELKNRVFSTLENPNVLAGYLDVFICLALGVLAKVGGRTQKFAMLIAILMLAACLAMTYARGAYFTIAIVFIVYGIIQDWRILIFFLIASIGIFYYDESFVHRLTSIFELTDSSQGLRVGIWVSTLAMIADHPFIGIGWGAFKEIYPSYDYYLRGADVLIYHAHNIFLHYAAEIGIIGAMAFFWCFFGIMLMSLDLGDNEKYQSLKDKFLEKVFGIDLKNRIINLKDEIKFKYSLDSGRLDKILIYKNILNEKLADASERLMNWISPPNENEIEAEIDEDIENLVEEHPKISLKKKISLEKKSHVEKNIDSDVKIAAIEISSDTTIAPIEIDSDVTESLTMSDTKVAAIEKVEEKPKTYTTSTKIVNLFENKSDQSKENEKIEESQPVFDWNEVKTISNRQLADGVKFGIGLAFLSMALNGLTDDLLFNIPTSMLMWLLAALASAIDSLPEEEIINVRRRKKR